MDPRDAKKQLERMLLSLGANENQYFDVVQVVDAIDDLIEARLANARLVGSEDVR